MAGLDLRRLLETRQVRLCLEEETKMAKVPDEKNMPQVGRIEELRRELSDYWQGSKCRCAKCGGLLWKIDDGLGADFVAVGGQLAIAVECFECGATNALRGGGENMVALAVE